MSWRPLENGCYVGVKTTREWCHLLVYKRSVDIWFSSGFIAQWLEQPVRVWFPVTVFQALIQLLYGHKTLSSSSTIHYILNMFPGMCASLESSHWPQSVPPSWSLWSSLSASSSVSFSPSSTFVTPSLSTTGVALHASSWGQLCSLVCSHCWLNRPGSSQSQRVTSTSTS